MREIKFQFWDTRCEQMFDFDPHADAPVLAGDIPECILRQFTGLFDKNGTEIYEGDIVTSWYDRSYYWEVYWDNELGRYWLKKNEKEGAKYGWLNCQDDVEIDIRLYEEQVVGNKYQNPQLLKESE